MQAYVVRFIGEEKGDISGNLPEWPPYETQFNTMNTGADGFNVQSDPWGTKRIRPKLLEMINDPENGV